MNYKELIIYTGSILSLTLLVSCGSPRSDSKPNNQETPEALEDKTIEIKSYGRSGSLMEELYQELVDNSPALQKLEEDLKTIRPKVADLHEKFNQYEGKSDNYYGAANYKATSIKDSLLRMKIMELIKKSSIQYSNKKGELISLLEQISDNGISLNDHHAVLKIVLTLPIIEKYQTDKRPDEKIFRDIIKDQEYLILSIDSLDGK